MLPMQAATIAEKLKASGATSVIFAAIRSCRSYLTKAVAGIGYFLSGSSGHRPD